MGVSQACARSPPESHPRGQRRTIRSPKEASTAADAAKPSADLGPAPGRRDLQTRRSARTGALLPLPLPLMLCGSYSASPALFAGFVECPAVVVGNALSRPVPIQRSHKALELADRVVELIVGEAAVEARRRSHDHVAPRAGPAGARSPCPKSGFAFRTVPLSLRSRSGRCVSDASSDAFRTEFGRCFGRLMA